jgi:hypothetical protein
MAEGMVMKIQQSSLSFLLLNYTAVFSQLISKILTPKTLNNRPSKTKSGLIDSIFVPPVMSKPKYHQRIYL